MTQKLRIVSKQDGFRRAGVAHHGTQTYSLDHFSDAELAALKAEPMLVVDTVEVPDEAGEAKADDARKAKK